MIGYPELKPHDLRRGVAMEVLEQHHDLEQVRALLGHSRIDTTQVYASTRPPQLKRAVSFYEEKAIRILTESVPNSWVRHSWMSVQPIWSPRSDSRSRPGAERSLKNRAHSLFDSVMESDSRPLTFRATRLHRIKSSLGSGVASRPPV